MDRSTENSTAQQSTARAHPVHAVHRIGSTALGVGLAVFGVLGLVDMPTFFGPGRETMGMGSNGALATLSVLVGVLLLIAAARSGRASSTVCLVVGALFLLSGFVHLGILDTTANLLGFDLANVFFSFAAGVVLLTLGAYGRMTGGLPPDNPYARAETTSAQPDNPPNEHPDKALADVEEAVASGEATLEQRAELRAQRAAGAGRTYDDTWKQFAETHTPDEVTRMRRHSDAESALGHPDHSA